MIPKEYEKYEKFVTLGAVNWHGEWGNKAANLEKMKAKMREAALLGVNMLCFPELALTGYECGEEARRDQKPCALHTEAAETIPGPSTEEIAKLAGELGMYVVFGMPEKDAKDSKAKYIAAAVVGPEGVLGSYRKLHLATPPYGLNTFALSQAMSCPSLRLNTGPSASRFVPISGCTQNSVDS